MRCDVDESEEEDGDADDAMKKQKGIEELPPCAVQMNAATPEQISDKWTYYRR